MPTAALWPSYHSCSTGSNPGAVAVAAAAVLGSCKDGMAIDAASRMLPLERSKTCIAACAVQQQCIIKSELTLIQGRVAYLMLLECR